MDENRFRRAARDGFMPTLGQATRRDCNATDEDGMTATLWAAHEGHLDALRLIVGRGGDPDRADHYGNTALHCAAAMGHMNCVTFLVNFGANLWALDNDLHSAKELAAIRGRDEVLRYLDVVIGKQEEVNQKTVKMLKERSLREAQRRIREMDRLQEKLDKKALKDESRLSQQRTKMTAEESGRTTPFTLVSTISKNTANFFGLSREKTPVDTTLNPKFSDLTLGGRTSRMTQSSTGGVSRRLKQKQSRQSRQNDFIVSDVRNGKKSLRSLRGLQRDSQVLYVSKEQGAGEGKAVEWESSQVDGEPSLFDRPGFGSVAFRTCVSASLNCLSESQYVEQTLLEEEDGEDEGEHGEDEEHDSLTSSDRRLAARDSIGSAGSLTSKSQRSSASPLSRADTVSSDWVHANTNSDDESSDPDLAALHLFLAAAGAAEFLPNFIHERIDLAALALLDEADLATLGLPLGPRRKLVSALAARRHSLENPGCISDTKL